MDNTHTPSTETRLPLAELARHYHAYLGQLSSRGMARKVQEGGYAGHASATAGAVERLINTI